MNLNIICTNTLTCIRDHLVLKWTLFRNIKVESDNGNNLESIYVHGPGRQILMVKTLRDCTMPRQCTYIFQVLSINKSSAKRCNIRPFQCSSVNEDKIHCHNMQAGIQDQRINGPAAHLSPFILGTQG